MVSTVSNQEWKNQRRGKKTRNTTNLCVYCECDSIMVLSCFVYALWIKDGYTISMWPRGLAGNRITGYTFSLLSLDSLFFLSVNDFYSQVHITKINKLFKDGSADAAAAFLFSSFFISIYNETSWTSISSAITQIWSLKRDIQPT